MRRLIGITGPSCSGKTEISRWISRHTGAMVLNLDHYYIDLSQYPIEVRARTNFDEPASVDHQAIIEHARELAAGRSIHAPLYNFATHTRTPGDEVVEPGRLVILEGLFALHWPELSSLFALKIYVNAPDEVCLQRRLDRDIRERGRTRESVLAQYEATVRPGAQLYIKPCRAQADLVLSGTDPIEDSGRRVMEALFGTP